MKKLFGMLLAVCVGTGLLALPAQADSPSDQFCNLTSSGLMTCYDSQASLLMEASGGRIHLAADATPADVIAAIDASNEIGLMLLSSRGGGVTPAMTVFQAYFFTDPNMKGNQLSMTSTNTCPGGGAANWPNFQAPYNNSISSGQLFAGCYGRGYDSPTVGASGAQFQFPYQAYYNTLPGFNDVMSSFKTCSASC